MKLRNSLISFKRAVARSGVKVQYVSGWGLTFNDSFDCKHYLNTHGVTEDMAMQLSAVMKLTFHDDILHKVEEFEYGELADSRELHFSEWSFPYRDIPLRKYYSFFQDEQGIHQLGGKPDVNFKMPEPILDSPFIYLGFIKNDGDVFGWIDTEIIHLVCPVFLAFKELYLSATDPLSPQVLSATVILPQHQDSPFSKDSFIEYQPVRFRTEINLDQIANIESLGNAGIPEWIQDAEIPGWGNETMRFLCQLRSNRIQAKDYKLHLENYPYGPENFTSLNFWGDGDLFVFYDPVKKLMHYRIQNT